MGDVGGNQAVREGGMGGGMGGVGSGNAVASVRGAMARGGRCGEWWSCVWCCSVPLSGTVLSLEKHDLRRPTVICLDGDSGKRTGR